MINNISIARNKKEVHVFLGRINFLRRFILNYAEIVQIIIEMLKKNSEMKWTPQSRDSLNMIKPTFTEAPMLVGPDYEKTFMIFSFASPHTIVAVLLQKMMKGMKNLLRSSARYSKMPN